MLQISNEFKCPLIGQQLWKKNDILQLILLSGLIALRKQALQIG